MWNNLTSQEYKTLLATLDRARRQWYVVYYYTSKSTCEDDGQVCDMYLEMSDAYEWLAGYPVDM